MVGHVLLSSVLEELVVSLTSVSKELGLSCSFAAGVVAH